MWDNTFALDILPKLLDALKITIMATVCGFALAMVIGLVFALLRRSSSKIVSWAAFGVIEFIRNTPLLVQVFFLFYVLPLYGVRISPFATGMIALGLHYGTYLSEVYRSGIDSIPKGQWEAATALNFSRVQTWTKIILPQALPPMVPVFGNYFIVMFKETPILSAIALVEVLQTAKIITSQTFRAVEPYTLVGLLFLILSTLSAVLIRRLELKLNRR
ncbi:ectoine/hydroxyectoine ABC transporter permease subunit EhuD [Paenibacillus turpanensis]|uniref:ectoine/hydroxyectoine ABC transporter permease subunit EhuD n=1 Tax=Paenibacillus turpanensis TaxID=2689078 RepID=UPI001408B0BB|nr:ectoine/hydroxyectoine ABC transporter permease subunit EhuD [Paenibacillus turpanensis]